MPTPQAIEYLIGKTIKEVLTDALMTDVDDDDATKADYVILGRPTSELRSNIVISVHTNHPLDSATDKRVDGRPRQSGERGFAFEREIGGSAIEVEYGAVEVRIRQDMPHEEALNTIAVIDHRVKKSISGDRRLRTIRDDLGNTMFWIETYKQPGQAAGGGNTSIFIRWIGYRAFISSDRSREE